jgi:SAM-dependent methyltransferase
MDIYDYCTTWARESSAPGKKVLDYGCGAGVIVQKLRASGIDANGCDVFYEGGDYSSQVASGLIAGGIIKRMDDDIIPFDDAIFDLVINNQVIEHVPDLDVVLAEINRVLKPGGKVLSLFPDRGVWREGHVGIPFLHWFTKGSRLRVAYAFALRCVGLGYHKLDKSRWQWSEDACKWIDSWTYYRQFGVIRHAFQEHIGAIRGLEADYLARRLGPRAGLLKAMPSFLSALVVRKLACLVFETRKAG